jgi:hypothetical protein
MVIVTILAITVMSSVPPLNIPEAHGATEVASINQQQSPVSSDSYEGERRLVKIGNVVFAFYYNPPHIKYKYSTNDGETWSAEQSTGTGSIGSDNFRWSLTSSNYNNIPRITLAYYKTSGSDPTQTNFFAKTYTVNGATLSLLSTDNLFSASNNSGCQLGTSGGVCAAATAATTTDGQIWLGYRWLSGNVWHYKVLSSSDGGGTWGVSLGINDVTATNQRFPITLTELNNNKMLISYAIFETGNLYSRYWDGSWTGIRTHSNTGMSSNTIKQISSDSNSQNAYVAYLNVTATTKGQLKVAKFSNVGAFQAFEISDPTSLRHTLPSISVTSDNILRIYTIADNKIYGTHKNSFGWMPHLERGFFIA